MSSRSSCAGSITSLSSRASSRLTIGPAPSSLTFFDSKFPLRRESTVLIELTDWPRQLIQSELDVLCSVCPGITNIQAIHHGARVIFSSNGTINTGLPLFKSIELAEQSPKSHNSRFQHPSPDHPARCRTLFYVAARLQALLRAAGVEARHFRRLVSISYHPR